MDKLIYHMDTSNRKISMKESSDDGDLAHWLYYCARDGLSKTMFALTQLNDWGTVNEALKLTVEDQEEQTRSALVAAAANGHTQILEILLKNYQVDIERECTVKVDSHLIDGATALWVAAVEGHLGVVKLLVEHGAEVNHATRNISTPLRAACYSSRLDIVSYLLKHGADVNIANENNHTCLMLASYKGRSDIVQCLLAYGAETDVQSNTCGSTALHCAAEWGHIDIVKELLRNDARMLANNLGLDPMMVAAERTRMPVVDYFVKQDYITRRQKIEATELLAASFACDKCNYSLELAYILMRKAMLMRFEDPDNVIEKPFCKPIAAYRNRIECRTVRDLDVIQNSSESLHMEALTIRERMLGQHNVDVAYSVVFRGAVYADNGMFDECIPLWIHAAHLYQINKKCLLKDLLRFAQVFAQVMKSNGTLEFCYLLEILSFVLYELRRCKEELEHSTARRNVKDDMDRNLMNTLCLITLTEKNLQYFDESQVYQLEKLVYQIVRVNAVSGTGKTLLHLSVNPLTPVDSFHTSHVCRYPCATTAKLLIKCGSDVNAVDRYRNTPLHLIVIYKKPMSDFMTLHNIIQELIKAGAHIDAANIRGHTPYQASCTGVAEIILKQRLILSLQCFAARTIKSHNISYIGRIPKVLESFVDMHGSGCQEDASTCAKDEFIYSF